MKKEFRKNRGESLVWASGMALACILIAALLMLGVIVGNGFPVFWPATFTQLTLKDGSHILGEVRQRQVAQDGAVARVQLKIGNRDLYGLDFRWVDAGDVRDEIRPADAIVLERSEHGDFYGFLKALTLPGGASAPVTWADLEHEWREVGRQRLPVQALGRRIDMLNAEIEGLRQRQLKLRYRGRPDSDPAMIALLARDTELKREFEGLAGEQTRQVQTLRQASATFTDAGGIEKTIALADIVRLYQPNRMGVAAKSWFYLDKLRELLFGQPREANTEGGLFPAIVGTVMMVFIMSVFSFPLGVMTAVYLREYAKDGLGVRLVRIAVNNLAGVPSIVYGIFGLGFFIYGVGGVLDRLLFPERLPTPTFGTGGILWASLTLALLTVPVVIVATEEALGAIPSGIREGSLALGATKLQTLTRILLPMASPGIMTGFILAMARAAGEVAPLMITGVVKLAPALPVDATFPFVHLERKFMHLGFHIYDIGFQSPNVEAANPMVFVTTLLLVLIVVVMSGFAIHLRNKMKKRYTLASF